MNFVVNNELIQSINALSKRLEACDFNDHSIELVAWLYARNSVELAFAILELHQSNQHAAIGSIFRVFHECSYRFLFLAMNPNENIDILGFSDLCELKKYFEDLRRNDLLPQEATFDFQRIERDIGRFKLKRPNINSLSFFEIAKAVDQTPKWFSFYREMSGHAHCSIKTLEARYVTRTNSKFEFLKFPRQSQTDEDFQWKFMRQCISEIHRGLSQFKFATKT
jgi:Family of unknown function (DUF5677)